MARPFPKLRLVARETLHTNSDRAARSDGELVRAVLAGESGAGDALWHKHAPMVFQLLGRALGPSSEVEDVAQDVFVTVFVRLGTLRDPDALQSFVYSVAVRVLQWEFRKRRARRMLQLWGELELPETQASELDAEARNTLLRLYGILDRLGAEERLVFVLRHLEGMKLEEIATSLEISLATTKRRLKRAGELVSAAVDRDPILASYETEKTP